MIAPIVHIERADRNYEQSILDRKVVVVCNTHGPKRWTCFGTTTWEGVKATFVDHVRHRDNRLVIEPGVFVIG